MMPANIGRIKSKYEKHLKMFEAALFLPQGELWQEDAPVLKNATPVNDEQKIQKQWSELYVSLPHQQNLLFIWSSEATCRSKLKQSTMSSFSKKPFIIISLKEAEVTPLEIIEEPATSLDTDKKEKINKTGKEGNKEKEEKCKTRYVPKKKQSLLDMSELKPQKTLSARTRGRSSATSRSPPPDQQGFTTLSKAASSKNESYKFTITSPQWVRMGNYHTGESKFSFSTDSKAIGEAWVRLIEEGIKETYDVGVAHELAIAEHDKIQYSEKEKRVLEDEFMRNIDVSQPIILKQILSIQKQEGQRGLAAWKKRRVELTHFGLRFYKPKENILVQVGSLDVGNVAVYGISYDRKNKIWPFQVDCDLWMKKKVSYWEPRSFIVGCSDKKEQEEWKTRIEEIVTQHKRARAQRKVVSKRASSSKKGKSIISTSPTTLRTPHSSKSQETKITRRGGSSIIAASRKHLFPPSEDEEEEVKDVPKIKLRRKSGEIITRSWRPTREESELLQSIDLMLGEISKQDLQLLIFGQLKTLLVNVRSYMLDDNMWNKKNSLNLISKSGVDVDNLNPRTETWLIRNYTQDKQLKYPEITPSPIIDISQFTDIESLQSWEWDIFQYENNSDLYKVIVQIFTYYDFFDKFKVDLGRFNGFCKVLTRKYKDNPFHNFRHAVYTTQTIFVLLSTYQGDRFLHPLEIVALLIAAICHDVDHPGTSNAYEVDDETALALLYNDQSVLENHHSFVVFNLMKEYDQCNILKSFTSTSRTIIRRTIINAILATDNNNHFKILNDFSQILEKQTRTINREIAKKKNYNIKTGQVGTRRHRLVLVRQMRGNEGIESKDRIWHLKKYADCFVASEFVKWLVDRKIVKDAGEAINEGNQMMKQGIIQHVAGKEEFENGDFFYRFNGNIGKNCSLNYSDLFLLNAKSRQTFISFVLHISDISAFAKPWRIANEWHKKSSEELLKQGDVGGSVVNRRKVDNTQKSVDFIDYILIPSFSLLSTLLPELSVAERYLQSNRKDIFEKVNASKSPSILSKSGPGRRSLNISSKSILNLESLKEGYLVKQGARIKNMKKRYFKLYPGIIRYYETDDEKTIKGELMLNNVSAAIVSRPRSKRTSSIGRLQVQKIQEQWNYGFQVSGLDSSKTSRILIVFARTKDQRTGWINAINKSIDEK